MLNNTLYSIIFCNKEHRIFSELIKLNNDEFTRKDVDKDNFDYFKDMLEIGDIITEKGNAEMFYNTLKNAIIRDNKYRTFDIKSHPEWVITCRMEDKQAFVSDAKTNKYVCSTFFEKGSEKLFNKLIQIK